jgi:glucosamine--fructose-6-phosphate aminotransferase (isomerizing)
MNTREEKYKKYALVKEMMESTDIIRNFNQADVLPFAQGMVSQKGIFLTGEGSSRIFPAKRAVCYALKRNFYFPVITEGCTQALEYKLDDYSLFVASNSGKTKETIRFATKFNKKTHKAIFGITANPGTKLNQLISDTYILKCGKEIAVPATKSVVEQGLFYDALLHTLMGEEMNGLKELADKFNQILTYKLEDDLIAKLKKADVIYFAGRNNGVAEELALKSNEIARKKSLYLEGTYALHGIEEVMDKKEVLIWIDPFEDEEAKFEECFTKGVGLTIIAISTRKTRFRTIIVPEDNNYAEFIQLAAGWNILVETGISMGLDIDNPKRARKTGNEYISGLQL